MSVKFVEYLKDKYGPWGWMGQRAYDACGVNLIMPLDFIISCDYGVETGDFIDNNKVFSLEKSAGVRKNWSNEDLKDIFSHHSGREIFDKWKGYDRPPSLLCYRSLECLEPHHQADSGFRPNLMAVPQKLKTYFDNKILLYSMLPELGVRSIQGYVNRTSDTDFISLREKLAMPFVVQYPYGSNGNLTFIVRNEKKYKRIKKAHGDKKGIFRKYIEGYSLNVNAIVLNSDSDSDVMCAYPSIQLTGLKECARTDSAFCGNDFTSAADLSERVLKKTVEVVRKVGRWMGGLWL